MKKLTDNQFQALLEFDSALGPDPLPELGLPKRNRNSSMKTLIKHGYLTEEGETTLKGKAYIVKMMLPLEWGDRCDLRDGNDMMGSARVFVSYDDARKRRNHTYGPIMAATPSADGLTTYVWKHGGAPCPIAVRTASMPRYALKVFGIEAPELKAVGS